MHRLHLAPLVLLTGLAGLVATTAHASAPAGVWALVDDVTLEPDGDNPTLVRIDGVLMIANVQPDFPDYLGYSVPQKGYMYYSCEDKQLATCVMEWKELLAIAGTADNCRGWGSNSLGDNGSVRHPQVPPADPDVYLVAQGVSPGFTPCEALRGWQMANPDDTTTGGDDSEGDTLHTQTTVVDSIDPVTGVATGDTATPDPTTGSATTNEPTTGEPPASDTGSLTGQQGGESSGGATGSTGSASSTGSGGSTGGAPIDEGDDKGCACNGGGGQGSAALVGLALLGLLRRRRG